MMDCPQGSSNTLQHGYDVMSEYDKLIGLLECTPEYEDPVIRAVYEKFKSKLPHPDALERYHIYHDCGKWICRTTDECGKNHYPNHAEISAQQYAHLWPEDGMTIWLIRHDMDIHTKKGDELNELWNHPLAPTLYFTAIAEVEANAELFGGRSSDSYKIKRKRLIKIGKKILKES